MIVEDERLRELREQIRALRRERDHKPTERTRRKIIALEDAAMARYVELAGIALETAKDATGETRAAVTAARQTLSDARLALVAGDGPVEAVLAAQDVLEAERRRLLHARIGEDAARATLAEAVIARHGVDAVEQVVGLPISVSVSPTAGAELRAALLGDVT